MGRIYRIAKTTFLAFCLTFGIGSGVTRAGDLRVMYFALTKDTVNKIKTGYQSNHKMTKITYTEVTSPDEHLAESVKKFDVLIGSSGVLGSVAESGAFLSLNKLIPKKILDDIMPAYIDAYSVDGNLAAVPITGFYSVLNYNGKTFSEAGLKPPEGSWTWKEGLYNACKKLSKDTNGDGMPDRWGILGLPETLYSSVIYGYGGSIADLASRRVKYTEKPAMDAIDFVVKLHSEKLAEVFDWSTYSSTNLPFFNGRSAMRLSYGLAKESPLEPGAPFIPGYSPVPKGPKGNIPVNFGTAAAIIGKSANKAEAINFIEYLLSIEGQMTIASAAQCFPITFPALKRKEITGFNRQELLNSYITGRAASFRPSLSVLEDKMWSDVLSLAKGDISRKQFLDRSLTYEKNLPAKRR